MSEEEKKAIKYLEFLSNEKCECEACQRAKKEYKTILNLIENQQNEIEELKEKNTQLTNYLNDSYYVSADEIRAIITEYQKQLQSADTERTAIMLSNFIMVLNDLLGEN